MCQTSFSSQHCWHMPRGAGRGRPKGGGNVQSSLVQQTAVPREVSVRRSLAACATVAWEGHNLKVSLDSNPTRWQFTAQVVGDDRSGDVTAGNFHVDVKAPNGKRARHTLRSLDYSSWLAPSEEPAAAVSNNNNNSGAASASLASASASAASASAASASAAAAPGRSRRSSSSRVPPSSPLLLNGGASSSSSMPLQQPLQPLQPLHCSSGTVDPAFQAFQQSVAALQVKMRAAQQRLARAKAAKAEATVGAKAVVAACDDPDEMAEVLSSWHDKLVRCDEEMRAATAGLGNLQAAAEQSTSQVAALLKESERQKHQSALKRAAANEAAQQQREAQAQEAEAFREQAGLRRALRQEVGRLEAAFVQ